MLSTLDMLALSLALNIVLGIVYYLTVRKLRSAVFSIQEVAAGRAEMIDLGDRIAVRSKVITKV